MVSNFNKKINSDPSSMVFFQIAGVLFLIIIVVLVIAVIKMYQKKYELQAEVAAYQQKISDIKKNSQTLKDEIANSGSNDYLEKIAYEQGLVRAGEREVIFTDSQEKPKVELKKQDFISSASGWFSSAWSWIKSKF